MNGRVALRGLLITVVGLVVAAVSVVLWSISRHDDRGDEAPSMAASAPLTPVPATTQAQEVALALGSLVDDPESLLAEGVGVLIGDVRRMFPEGTSVDPVVESWAPDGTGAGGTITVVVTQPGQSPQSFMAVMVEEGGKWKVLATLEDADV